MNGLRIRVWGWVRWTASAWVRRGCWGALVGVAGISVACAAEVGGSEGRGAFSGDWERIEPFLKPPAAWAGDTNRYASWFKRVAGEGVLTEGEWRKRRREIEREWHERMGPWPALIEAPKLEVIREERRETFLQQRVRVETAPGQGCEGWLLRPEGAGRKPAVVVVYYEPETSVGLNPQQLFRDFALQLARRGFVTLSIGTPGGNAYRPDVAGAKCQPLSFYAYVGANLWTAMSRLSDVDSDRIGIVGHSYGGKWAMFAGAFWERYACVAVSDPGVMFDERRPSVNYWEPWYLGWDPNQLRPKAGVPTKDNPRTGAYRKLVEEGRDLHEVHALISPRPFWVSGGAEDGVERWEALWHARELNRRMGFGERVGLSLRKEHSPNEESNAQLYSFFEVFLKDSKNLRMRRPDL